MSRKGLQLTDRDIEILKYLANGPAFSDDLRTRFFVKSGKPISRRAFERRMKKLQDANCLQSIPSQRKHQEKLQNNGRIYAITEESLEVLVRNGMSVERIRLVDLNKRSIPREMILIRLIRKICEFEGPCYEVTRLYDDGMMSRWIPRGRIRWIPDLLLSVQRKDESSFSFLLELDKGSSRTTEFSQKLAAFTQVNRFLGFSSKGTPFGIFIVCTSEDRMRFLQGMVEEDFLTTKIKAAIAFNTIHDLESSLDPLNSWYRADGTRIENIFSEIDRFRSEQDEEDKAFGNLFGLDCDDSNVTRW